MAKDPIAALEQGSAANRPLRVFLCYTHDDHDTVLALYQRLKAEGGILPWMDKQDMLAGQTWQREIPKAVQQADVVVACLSQRFVTKAGYGHTEITLALDTAAKQPDGTIFVIPLRLENCDPPDRLRHLHWCDYFEDDGYERLIAALRHRAAELHGPQPRPATPAPPRQASIPAQPAQPSKPAQPTPPARPSTVRSRINPLFPVTIPEWQAEAERCNQTFGDPVGYWCYVRPGFYAVGGWEVADPVETIWLDGFWIAKYPITVQQYSHFMHKGGYTTRDYWTPNGWTWRTKYDSGKGRHHPYYWPGKNEHSGINSNPNQPVTTLTWYEASAFARWLSLNVDLAMAGTDGSDGSVIRLPTDAEWEAAAAYDVEGTRHTYPWGKAEPDEQHADFGRDWDDGPALVGTRPAGAAACGAHNMVGGVWEPMASAWEGYPVHAAQVVDDLHWSNMAYRGGAWGNSSTYVRCVSRVVNHSGGGPLDDLGVRVARLFS